MLAVGRLDLRSHLEGNIKISIISCISLSSELPNKISRKSKHMIRMHPWPPPVNIRPLTILRRLLAILWQGFMDSHHFSPTRLATLLGSGDFPNCLKGSVVHLCWSHSFLVRRSMQITISHQCGNHAAKQYLACSYWKYCFVVRSGGFTEGDVENSWNVTRYHLISCSPCLREQQVLPRGYADNYWRWSHQKKTVTFNVSRWKNFLQVSRIGAELINWPWRPVHTVQGRLLATGQRPRHPDRWPRLTPHHRCHCRILAGRPQIWNHQHWSHAILDDESMVGLWSSCLQIPLVSMMQQSTSLSTTPRKTQACPLQL